MTEPRTYHPEATAYDGWERGGALFLIDTETHVPVARCDVSRTEWQQLVDAGVDHLFSGQVTSVTREDAERQVSEVLGRGFGPPA